MPRAHAAVDRVVWGFVLFGALFVIAAARALTPSPTGVGTHEQLGLPPCAFLALTGKPCPACGLTTAFAHVAHFELGRALEAHPLGPPLFALTLLLVPAALHGLARGRPLLAFVEHFVIDRVALLVAGGLLLVWAVRLAS